MAHGCGAPTPASPPCPSPTMPRRGQMRGAGQPRGPGAWSRARWCPAPLPRGVRLFPEALAFALRARPVAPARGRARRQARGRLRPAVLPADCGPRVPCGVPAAAQVHAAQCSPRIHTPFPHTLTRRTNRGLSLLLVTLDCEHFPMFRASQKAHSRGHTPPHPRRSAMSNGLDPFSFSLPYVCRLHSI